MDFLLDKAANGEANSKSKALHIVNSIINEDAFDQHKKYLKIKRYRVEELAGPIAQNILDKLDNK